ncbi:MAG: hypothetical protein KIT09_32990 [Bryobacteraceae bacterium]|nr:hypothetical protein [Bryobacteraceae bacterium]
MVRLVSVLLVAATTAVGQKPVIYPGGIVNAASYASGNRGPYAIGGSIASIFGNNLATQTLTADSVPLPTMLGGTSISVAGVPAPLFFVSPGQINIQIPSSVPLGADPVIVVSTLAGTTEPVRLDDYGPNFGVFSLDGSGCGRGAVLNIRQDGNVSLNSPSNAASPGDFLAIFGTGMGAARNAPDGVPAPSDPPAVFVGATPVTFFKPYLAPPPYNAPFELSPLQPVFERATFVGRAPGLVGVDQLNVQIPENAPEGCTVPVTTAYLDTFLSQPVPVAIRSGGGSCVDPPLGSYGLLTWERTITSGAGADGETETFTAILTAAPGMQAPPTRETSSESQYAGFCPTPGHRPLDAGTLTVQGPGFGPAEAVAALDKGHRVLRATLPRGSIQPGQFEVRAGGGAEISAFESSVRIGSGIQVATPFPPGTHLSPVDPITLKWTGGDPDGWVIVNFVHPSGTLIFSRSYPVRATAGTFTLPVLGGQYPHLPLPSGATEIVLEVTPDPSMETVLTDPGLSLGGRHTWKYTYRYGGLWID